MIQIKIFSDQSAKTVEAQVNDFIKHGIGDPENLETIQTTSNRGEFIATVFYEVEEDED